LKAWKEYQEQLKKMSEDIEKRHKDIAPQYHYKGLDPKYVAHSIDV